VSPTPCFLLEPTDRVELSLRIYTQGVHEPESDWERDHPRINPCPALEPDPHGYRRGHDAKVVIGEASPIWGEDHRRSLAVWPDHFEGDDRWPAECAQCHGLLPSSAARQVNQELIYRRSDGREDTTIRNAPPGALWFADWMNIERYRGPDGRTLCARCPGGHDWVIDSVASNCTLPDDETHRCWMRHGTPPNITVDKEPEPPFDHTCDAGAGSIQAGDYHGFLTNGAFT
jgi:hypothetical protein